MVDVFVTLLEDAEEELGLGKDNADLKRMGDKLKERLYLLADAIAKLQKKDWSWTTGTRDLYLHKASIPEDQAKRELKDAGIPEHLFHIVH